MEKDRVKCTRCRHTSKPGLVDENGVCPCCVSEDHAAAEARGLGGDDE